MEFDVALREFADLLQLASAALRNLIEQEESRAEIAELPQLLCGVEKIASRLTVMADRAALSDKRGRQVL